MDDADPKDVVPQKEWHLDWFHKDRSTFLNLNRKVNEQRTMNAVTYGMLMEQLSFLEWLEQNHPYAIRFWRHQWEKEKEKG